ncbi:MAG: hypothetical protein H6713_36930 [Myxococcales bacterium]|nr:hypothetical protein [Myxococcales bacterium]MCB9755548.1 hypothetical protein [Myxococcales bacterium]
MTERWQLIAGFMPPTWAIVLLAVCALAASAEALWALQRDALPLPARLAILALRLLAIAGLFAVAFELSLAIDHVREYGPRVVVLVDDSASMGIADRAAPRGPATARVERVQAFFADERTRETLATWRARGIDVEFRAFAESTQVMEEVVAKTGDEPEPLPLTADKPASNLARALSRLVGDPGDAASASSALDPRPLAGVVIVSDGLVAEDDGADAALVQIARELETPLTTISAGAPHLRDISVTRVRAGEFAFVENISEFEVELVAHGLAGEQTVVELRRDGVIIASTPLRLAADGVVMPLRFEVAPDRTGQFVFEVVVHPASGEATTANNRWPFVVKVLRDKVRVLHVSGRPDWDVRALRTLMRKDPNVELLSYYILRGLDDSDREDRSAPLSLIAFPTDALFEEELGSFDLVILHNFDAVNHRVGRYLGNIAQYVQEGGALVVIGGDLGLATGDYRNPDLAAIMPVDIQVPTGLDTRPFRPRMTDAARRHPVTARLAEAGFTRWDGLPDLDSYNPIQANASTRSGLHATTLLERQSPDEPGTMPLLMTAEPGRGRVLVLATGSTWRLGFAADLPLVDGARPYDLLWLGVIRWLLRDASSERLTLETDRASYGTHAPVTLRATALSTSYAPEPEVGIHWLVRPLTRDGLDEGSAPGGADAIADAIARGEWTTDSLGRASETLDPLPAGSYEATARRIEPDTLAEPVDGEVGVKDTAPHARRVFLVREAGHELAWLDADPGRERLARLAEATGGVALALADAGAELPVDLPLRSDGAAEGQENVESRRQIALWDSWGALLLVLLGFAGEWLVRRQSGLR